jgi:hypothetical protein
VDSRVSKRYLSCTSTENDLCQNEAQTRRRRKKMGSRKQELKREVHFIPRIMLKGGLQRMSRG